MLQKHPQHLRVKHLLLTLTQLQLSQLLQLQHLRQWLRLILWVKTPEMIYHSSKQ